MFVSEEPTVLHADLDSFYASVEQRDHPRLRARPVIVGGGVVLAASYEARAWGVRTAMGGAQARRLCPQAVVVPPRMSAYSEASKAVFEVFDQTTPMVEALSIDEAFLDVRGMRRIAGSPIEMAEQLRRDVREHVGLPITVGIARTKFLAKVASGVAKPDGLLCVSPDRELAFLHPLEVERLWGVGPITAQNLREQGSLRWDKLPRWARQRSCRSSDGPRGGTSMRWRTTVTRGGCARGRDGARSARSERSAVGRSHGTRSTPSSSRSWTA